MTLRASYRSTTDAFAVMLVSVLVPLAFGATLGSWLRGRRVRMGSVLAAAGAAILVVTPLIERFDYLGERHFTTVWSMCLTWLAGSLPVLGLPILLLGTCLPWLLKDHAAPASWGRRTPSTRWARSRDRSPRRGVCYRRSASWPGVAARQSRGRRVALRAVVRGVLAPACARCDRARRGDRRRVGRGTHAHHRQLQRAPVAHRAFEEGVDATLAVADTEDGQRLLFIDGFVATGESSSSHYMAWMGRLPMLVHPAPRRALVICFGTGQTANAVRRENPESLDIVDLSSAVPRAAPLFPRNEGVLYYSRVHANVMDGRAWLRRTDHVYDVVTLEPMPPRTFAGVNALYSHEFYELVAARLARAEWRRSGSPSTCSRFTTRPRSSPRSTTCSGTRSCGSIP